MNILALLRERFRPALAEFAADVQPLLEMIRVAQDPKFGDYQANFAMALSKQLGKTPKEARDLAVAIAAKVDVADLCDSPEVAGPGFINLRLKNDWLGRQLGAALEDPRLGVGRTEQARTYVIDYSGPNVAKPMHVGHIRSTVIGDALDRVLRFLGHRVVSDNHVGDWGTQFGMIIYGYKHFVNREQFQAQPVQELARLYKFVSKLVGYHEACAQLPKAQQQVTDRQALIVAAEQQAPSADKKEEKKRGEALAKLRSQLSADLEAVDELQTKIDEVNRDSNIATLAKAHPQIGTAVLEETAKLHAEDPENLGLWNQFLPHCRDEIQRVYRRLNVKFDHELGESFYHPMLGPTVVDLITRGLATESEGALCVFLEGFDIPMIIRKRDGAFLYATTDLATINYRMEQWHPDAILYVVDHRQSDHFEMLFALARKLGCEEVELKHVSFGTIMGEDRRPFKTRSGDTVGLEGLLDKAVEQALAIVSENDERKPNGAELSPAERQAIAEQVGIGALKYADLSQNRTTDYIFSYKKMLAMEGNTATYMQYSHARVSSIFRRGEVDPRTVRSSAGSILLQEPAERALGMALVRFEEALEDVLNDYRPNVLTAYLFELAQQFSAFFEKCSVLKAETDQLKLSRLKLCDLTARTIRKGLELLGIGAPEKM